MEFLNSTLPDVYVSSLAPCEGLRRAGAAQVVDLFLAAQMVQKCVETHQGAAASTLVMLESACPHQVCVEGEGTVGGGDGGVLSG